MAEIYLYTFVSVFVVSAISMVGVFALSLKEALLRKYIFILVSLAVGALLGDALIHLIPESFADLDATLAGLLVIAGILLFFILEKGLHWHHSHGLDEAGCEDKHPIARAEADGAIHPIGYMILVSDGVHNFLDGVIIGASYLVSIEVGLATTLAVALHEIPQEIGDFGVLLHSGFSKMGALLVNFLSALTAVLGAVIVLVLYEFVGSVIPWLIPLTAGAFIYIAASDLIPELHKVKRVRQSALQLFAILIGVMAMLLLVFIEADGEHGNDEGIELRDTVVLHEE